MPSGRVNTGAEDVDDGVVEIGRARRAARRLVSSDSREVTSTSRVCKRLEDGAGVADEEEDAVPGRVGAEIEVSDTANGSTT